MKLVFVLSILRNFNQSLKNHLKSKVEYGNV